MNFLDMIFLLLANYWSKHLLRKYYRKYDSTTGYIILYAYKKLHANNKSTDIDIYIYLYCYHLYYICYSMWYYPNKISIFGINRT